MHRLWRATSVYSRLFSPSLLHFSAPSPSILPSFFSTCVPLNSTKMALNVPTIKLNSGHQMPVFGLGTWQSKPGEVEQAVKDAIDVGYRHIDGAMVYENEKEVGNAIQAKIAEGVVKREDLFITSKLWNSYHHPDSVLKGLRKTLSDLKLAYLDLYLIHWPIAFRDNEEGNLFPKDSQGNFDYVDADFVDTWKSMEEAVSLGLTRSIGVSNFNSKQLERVFAVAKIPPAVNQIEVHPYLNNENLVKICQGRGVAVTGYSPLGCPARPGAKETDEKLLDNPKFIELAQKYGKTPAQLVIRWQIDRGLIVIPKTVTKSRMVENANVFDFKLTPEDVQYLGTFNRENGRGGLVPFWSGSKFYPFTFVE